MAWSPPPTVIAIKAPVTEAGVNTSVKPDYALATSAGLLEANAKSGRRLFLAAWSPCSRSLMAQAELSPTRSATPPLGPKAASSRGFTDAGITGNIPAAPVFLDGRIRAAGSAVAVSALENMPPNTVDRAFLLSPSLSAAYDVRPALKAVKRPGCMFTISRRFTSRIGDLDRHPGQLRSHLGSQQRPHRLPNLPRDPGRLLSLRQILPAPLGTQLTCAS